MSNIEAIFEEVTLSSPSNTDTSVKDVVISLQRFVTVTHSPAEAEVDFP